MTENITENPVADPLSTILDGVHLRASIYANPTLCGAWQMDASDHPGAQFHLIARGSCFLHSAEGGDPVELRAGDLCVFPRGAWHLLSSDSMRRESGSRLGERGHGPLTDLVCGSITVCGGVQSALFDALSDVIVVRAEQLDSRFRAVLQLLAEESLAPAAGSRLLMDRLAEALVLLLLRYQLQLARPDARGLLAALADTRIRSVLIAVRGDLARPWSLQVMAELAGMSRSAFAARFTQLLGVPPMSWLARQRMAEAQRLFADPRNSVARVAARLGYAGEVAFRRAYKRITGQTPGRERRRHRHAAERATGE